VKEEKSANAEALSEEQGRRAEKEQELDILAKVAGKMIGRDAKHEDKIAVLKAALREAEKSEKKGGHDVDSLLGKFFNLLNSNAVLKAALKESGKEIKASAKDIDSLLKKVFNLLNENLKLEDEGKWQKQRIGALKFLLKHDEARGRIAIKLAERLKERLESLKEKQKLKAQTEVMVKQMIQAAKNKQVAWDRRQQIIEILSTVNLRDRSRMTSRKNSPIGTQVETKAGTRFKASDIQRRAEIERMIEEHGETEGRAKALEAGFTKKDLDLLKLTSMDKTSIEELRAIHEEIMSLANIGRRERTEQVARERENVIRETDAQMTELRKDTAGRAPEIMGSGESKKRYTFAAAKQDAIRRAQAADIRAFEDEITDKGLELTQDEYDARVEKIMIEAYNRIDDDFAGNIKRGLKRKWDYVTDEIIMVIADPHRLFDLLDGGNATFKGPFVKFWIAEMNRCKDNMNRMIEKRIGVRFENKLAELGLSKVKFYEQVRISGPLAEAVFAGKFPTRARLLGLYVLSKDPDGRRSLIRGNFSGVPGAEAFIDKCISELSDNEKALGDFIFDDLNESENFERANRVWIATTGEGMIKRDNYVTIYRVDRNPYLAEIDAKKTLEQLDKVDSRGRPSKVEPSFTHSRVNASTEIETDIFKVWTRHVREEEHFIAYGETLKKARSILFQPDPQNPKQTMAHAINEKYGSYVFRRVIEEYNKRAMPDIMRAHSVFDNLLGRFISGRAISALSYNVATWLKNYTSMTKWFIEAHPMDVLSSLQDYAKDSDAFYERAFAMDPQIAQRKGSYIQTAMKEGRDESRSWLEDAANLAGGEKAREGARKVIDAGMAPNAMIDKWVASIMFDSAYKTGLRNNLSSEEARSEAQMTVQRLMQPTDAMELPGLYMQGGLWRTLLLFSTEAMKTINIAAYDIPRQVKSGQYAKATRSAFAISLAAIILKGMTSGISALGDSPDGDEGEDKKNWFNWLLTAIIENTAGQIPVIGDELMDAIEGKDYGKDYTIVTDPFWKIWNGARKILEGKREEENGEIQKLMRNGYTKEEYGVLAMAQGFSLLVGAPFSQVQRIYRARDAQDFADVLLINLGNQKALERAQQNAKKRNAANW
jgi:hypothetical protein